MDSKNLKSWAKALTVRFLRVRPNLEEHRSDLEQEAALAILQAQDAYDPKLSKGMDKDLYTWFIVRGELQKYIDRREKKHWLSPEQDQASPYWDLEELPDTEALPSEEPDHASELWDALYGIEWTPNQKVVLESYLATGTHARAIEILGVGKQRLSQIWKDIIKKAQKANDLEDP